MPILNINDSSQKYYKGSHKFRKSQSKSFLLSFLKDIKNIDLNLLNMNKTYAKNTDAVIYEIKYIIMENINNQN